MLKAILRHITRILRALLSAPARLLGLGGSPHPPSPEYEELVDDQVEELQESLNTSPVGSSPEPTELGDRIHEYASGDTTSRRTVDLSGIPDHVAIALCTMPADQLRRLAIAGPSACGKWADGEKGLVGVPLPLTNGPGAVADEKEKRDTPAPEVVASSEPRGLAFA